MASGEVAEQLRLWLARLLAAERCALELRHQALLAALQGQADAGGLVGQWHELLERASHAPLASPVLTVPDAELAAPPSDGSGASAPPPVSLEPTPSDSISGVVKRMSLMSHASTETCVPPAANKLEFSTKYKHGIVHHEPFLLGRFEHIVKGDAFEAIFSGVIFLNTLIMAIEAQYTGTLLGQHLEYHNYPKPGEAVWTGAVEIFEWTELIFGILFTLELAAKMMALRCSFPFDPWNGVDFAVVLSWFVVTLGAADLPLDPMFLRLARLCRLLRLLKLVRTIKGFDALYLMTTAMRGSISVLFWSVVLLVLVLMMCALFLQMSVEPYIHDPNVDLDRRLLVFQYYGSFARNMLTMFEITLGNWMPPCRALVENVSEQFILFFLIHKLIIGFSVVSVLTGVFIQETFKVATQDDRIMVMHKERAFKTHVMKMRALFDHADDNCNGEVSLDEFRDLCEDDGVRMWLSSMELDIVDVEAAFGTLDKNKDGTLSPQELVSGIGKLRGPARSLDLLTLRSQIEEIRENVLNLQRTLLLGQADDPKRIHVPKCDTQQNGCSQVNHHKLMPAGQFVHDLATSPGQDKLPCAADFLLEAAQLAFKDQDRSESEPI